MDRLFLLIVDLNISFPSTMVIEAIGARVMGIHNHIGLIHLAAILGLAWF